MPVPADRLSEAVRHAPALSARPAYDGMPGTLSGRLRATLLGSRPDSSREARG